MRHLPNLQRLTALEPFGLLVNEVIRFRQARLLGDVDIEAVHPDEDVRMLDRLLFTVAECRRLAASGVNVDMPSDFAVWEPIALLANQVIRFRQEKLLGDVDASAKHRDPEVRKVDAWLAGLDARSRRKKGGR